MDGLQRCEVLQGQTEAFLTTSTWLRTKVQDAPLTASQMSRLQRGRPYSEPRRGEDKRSVTVFVRQRASLSTKFCVVKARGSPRLPPWTQQLKSVLPCYLAKPLLRACRPETAVAGGQAAGIVVRY